MIIQPNLVDFSLFKKAVPKAINRPITVKLQSANNSLLINTIGILILCVALIFMYQRLLNRDDKEIEKQNTIIGFHQYVKANIK